MRGEKKGGIRHQEGENRECQLGKGLNEMATPSKRVRLKIELHKMAVASEAY